MTDTLDIELVERLLRRRSVTNRWASNRTGRLVNPDGPEAADRIERLAAEGVKMGEEAIREAAAVAKARRNSYAEPTDWDYGAQDACTIIERDILAALSPDEGASK